MSIPVPDMTLVRLVNKLLDEPLEHPWDFLATVYDRYHLPGGRNRPDTRLVFCFAAAGL